jgi:hypothetical protein
MKTTGTVSARDSKARARSQGPRETTSEIKSRTMEHHIFRPGAKKVNSLRNE